MLMTFSPTVLPKHIRQLIYIHVISKIAQWSVDNSHTLNHSKCKYMILSRKKRLTVISTPVLLNRQPLELY